MALSKRKLTIRNVFKGFHKVQRSRYHYLSTDAYFDASAWDQKMLSSKHHSNSALHGYYAGLCKAAHEKYNRLVTSFNNGMRCKYAFPRF